MSIWVKPFAAWSISFSQSKFNETAASNRVSPGAILSVNNKPMRPAARGEHFATHTATHLINTPHFISRKKIIYFLTMIANVFSEYITV